MSRHIGLRRGRSTDCKKPSLRYWMTALIATLTLAVITAGLYFLRVGDPLNSMAPSQKVDQKRGNSRPMSEQNANQAMWNSRISGPANGISRDRSSDQREVVVKDFLLSPWLDGLSYETVKEKLSQDDLPILYGLLSEPTCLFAWPLIAQTIGWLGGGERSVRVLRDYIARKDDFPNLQRAFYFGKVRALEAIGLVGGSEAEAVLLSAFTPEGALELTQEWFYGNLPEPYNKDRNWLILDIRGEAASGLVYSGVSSSLVYRCLINISMPYATETESRPYFQRKTTGAWFTSSR